MQFHQIPHEGVYERCRGLTCLILLGIMMERLTVAKENTESEGLGSRLIITMGSASDQEISIGNWLQKMDQGSVMQRLTEMVLNY